MKLLLDLIFFLVLKVVKEQKEVLEEQTGIPPSVTKDEMKKYLDEVLQEREDSRRAT
jgi:hypothetical protein